MKKMFIAMAVLSTVFVCAHESEAKVENIAVEDHTNCDGTDHEEHASVEEVAPSLACSNCDKDRK